MGPALLAASIAAIAAALLSLPLRSPSDALLNSATVVIATLIVGIGAGLVWSRLAGNANRLRNFGITMAASLGVVTVVLVASESQVERMVSFGLPLTALAFVAITVMTVSLESVTALQRRWATPVALVAAVVIGGALAGQGDAESGRLELPARATTDSAPVATPTQASAPTATTASQLDPTATSAPTAAAEPTPIRSSGSTPTTAATPTATASVGSAPTAIPTSPPQPTATATTAAPTATPSPTPITGPVFDEQRAIGSYDGVTFLVSDGSEATFTVQEQLTTLPLPNDAVIRTTGLSGEIHLDGRPSTIMLNLKSMRSDQRFRDRYVSGTMFRGFSTGTFTVDSVSPPDGFASGEEVVTQATGTLDIRDVQLPITFDIQARDDGNVLFILGRTTFTWDELGITKPTARSVVSVEDEVRVEILLSARPIVGQ